MKDGSPLKRFGGLRLVFASAVIFSHAPALVYGDLSRDPLAWAGNGASLGGLAVDGFFIVSGYLITGSYLNSASRLAYAAKRILRIYPAFVCMFLILAFAVAPWGGGMPVSGAADFLHMARRALLLLEPQVPDAFAQLHLAAWQQKLNLPVWTLPCEALCYAFVPIFDMAGVLRRNRMVVLGLTLILFLIRFYLAGVHVGHSQIRLDLLCELLAMFSCGICYYLFRDRVKFSPWAALGAALFVLSSLFFTTLSPVIIGVFGGYLIFYLAQCGWMGRMFGWAERADFSYGLYICAWPIALILLTLDRHISALHLAAVNWVLAMLAAVVSWYGIERPALRLKRFLPSPSQLKSRRG